MRMKIPGSNYGRGFLVVPYADNAARDTHLFLHLLPEFFFYFRSVGKAQHNALLEVVGSACVRTTRIAFTPCVSQV